jgi:hypothetical protein
MSITKLTMAQKVEANFDPSNPFHQALKKHGEDIYLQVIERATEAQKEAIANSAPIVDIVADVKARALEIFANKNIMKGIHLEHAIGL